MQAQSKIKKILQNERGASLIFILGIMLLLMAIGTSVLVAATTNAGYVVKQSEHSQIMILDESIHKNIMYSLQHDEADEDLLSAQLVRAIYYANDADPSMGLERLELDCEIDGLNLNSSDADNDSNIQLESITLEFPLLEQSVVISEPVDAIWIPTYDEYGNEVEPAILSAPREPKTATVDVIMTVTVKIKVNDSVSTSRATYEYTGGILSDATDGKHMVFEEDGYGEWRLLKYEKVHS